MRSCVIETPEIASGTTRWSVAIVDRPGIFEPCVKRTRKEIHGGLTMPDSPIDDTYDPFAAPEVRGSKKRRKSKRSHRKPTPGGRGQAGRPGPLDRQIKKLKARLTEEFGELAVKDAEDIVRNYPPDVIKLAFKLLPKRHVAKLGKRTEDLLIHVPETERPEVEASLKRALEKKGGVDA